MPRLMESGRAETDSQMAAQTVRCQKHSTLQIAHVPEEKDPVAIVENMADKGIVLVCSRESRRCCVLMYPRRM